MAWAAARRSHSALVDIRRQLAADVKSLLRRHYLAGLALRPLKVD